MKKIHVFRMMAAVLLLSGCHKTGVKLADMRTPPTATISNGLVTVFLPGSYLGSNTWVLTKSKFVGETLCLSGYRTTSEPEEDHQYVVKLSASVSSESMRVIWIDPDGGRVPVMTIK